MLKGDCNDLSSRICFPEFRRVSLCRCATHIGLNKVGFPPFTCLFRSLFSKDVSEDVIICETIN